MQKGMSILRITSFDDLENADQLEKIEKVTKKRTSPFNSRNELRTINELLKFCRKQLHGYKRTLKGDKQASEREDLPINLVNSLHITIADKEILMKTIE